MVHATSLDAIEGAKLLSRFMPMDRRGWFTPLYQSNWFNTEGPLQFNCSKSRKGVWRGFHFTESSKGEGKFVNCLSGSIVDFLFDVREGSPTYGNIVDFNLTGDSSFGVYIPPGVGHGFYALEESLVAYAVTRIWQAEDDRGYHYDSDVARDYIKERISIIAGSNAFASMILSDKDMGLPRFLMR